MLGWPERHVDEKFGFDFFNKSHLNRAHIPPIPLVSQPSPSTIPGLSPPCIQSRRRWRSDDDNDGSPIRSVSFWTYAYIWHSSRLAIFLNFWSCYCPRRDCALLPQVDQFIFFYSMTATIHWQIFMFSLRRTRHYYVTWVYMHTNTWMDGGGQDRTIRSNELYY